MQAFWVKCGNNFGDELTHMIMLHKYREDLTWCNRKTTPFVSTGSLLDLMPDDWSGVILGSGFMWQRSTTTLPRASAVLVRGALTAKKLGREAPHGDPGLIVSDLVPSAPKEHKVGVIPHYIDKDLALKYPDAMIIDIRQNPYDFLYQVSSCEEIVTSSLHGLITADSYGIPRTWVPHDKVLGGGFKFFDYASSLHQYIRPHQKNIAPVLKVQELKENIHSAFDEYYRRSYGL
jgi:pyruvyltransferase